MHTRMFMTLQYTDFNFTYFPLTKRKLWASSITLEEKRCGEVGEKDAFL